MLLSAELSTKELILLLLKDLVSMLIFIWLLISTEVRKRRRKKSLPQRRKTNTFTKELNLPYTLSTQLMVFIFLLRKGKCESTA